MLQDFQSTKSIGAVHNKKSSWLDMADKKHNGYFTFQVIIDIPG